MSGFKFYKYRCRSIKKFAIYYGQMFKACHVIPEWVSFHNVLKNCDAIGFKFVKVGVVLR